MDELKEVDEAALIVGSLELFLCSSELLNFEEAELDPRDVWVE